MLRLRNISVLTLTVIFALTETALGVNVPSEVIIYQSLPGAPASLNANASSATQVTLSWTDNSTNEDGFRVERKTGSGSYSEIGTTGVSTASYTDNSALPNTTYTYRVRAYNSDGNSSYSNESSATTPASVSSGGGGGVVVGGSGGGAPSYMTKAIFRGQAYPSSDVTLLRDAQVVATTKAGPDARFEVEIENLTAGTYLFGVWAEDKNGNRSITHTFSISITLGATTVVSGIFIPPFLGIDKSEVKRGDLLTFYGSSVPGATVSIVINSDAELLKNATATGDGTWTYKLDTNELEYGDHSAKSRAALNGDITTFGKTQTFKVGDKNVAVSSPAKCAKADLNTDCKVNLVDFSILAYWYKRAFTSSNRKIDLNGDGKITLIDFSILAFQWTG